MTAKEYLRQIWNIDREIEIKRQHLQKLQAEVGIKAMPDPNENVGHSGSPSDPVSDTAVKIAALEEQIQRKLNRMADLQLRISAQIDGMESRTFRNVLTCRYILMQNWDQVAESCGYSVQHVHRVHGKALQEFTRLYLRMKMR